MAGLRAHCASDNIEQRGLTRTVRPDQESEFPTGERERDVG